MREHILTLLKRPNRTEHAPLLHTLRLHRICRRNHVPQARPHRPSRFRPRRPHRQAVHRAVDLSLAASQAHRRLGPGQGYRLGQDGHAVSVALQYAGRLPAAGEHRQVAQVLGQDEGGRALCADVELVAEEEVRVGRGVLCCQARGICEAEHSVTTFFSTLVSQHMRWAVQALWS
jgi:hypothetical protein